MHVTPACVKVYHYCFHACLYCILKAFNLYALYLTCDRLYAVADCIGRSLLLICWCDFSLWAYTFKHHKQENTTHKCRKMCVFPWHSQALQSAIGGWISGLAVVSKTCFGSPPGPLWIKCECSTVDVMQKHRKNGWMLERKREERSGKTRKEDGETNPRKNIMRDFICSS